MIDLNMVTAEDLDAVLALTVQGYEIVRYREERSRFPQLRTAPRLPPHVPDTQSQPIRRVDSVRTSV